MIRSHRPKSCINLHNVQNHPSTLISNSSMAVSRLPTMSFSNLISKGPGSPTKRQKNNSLGSFGCIWRDATTSKCRKSLQKQLYDPVRITLKEKLQRISDKRKQQQLQYQKTKQLVRKKCQYPSKHEKQKFLQAKILFREWMTERNLEINRYSGRLSRMKS